MSRPLAVLRPEPGATATASRIEALGLTAIKLPLFVVRPLAWEAPEHGVTLLLTSANAVRHAGPGLAKLAHLPVIAVGDATAAAARAAGLEVRRTGSGGADDLLASLAAEERHGLVHLSGRESRLSPHWGATSIPVYTSEAIAKIDVAPLAGAVALVHSPRAGSRLAALADAQRLDRASLSIAAISSPALAAVGEGWRSLAAAMRPRDDALIDAARALAD